MNGLDHINFDDVVDDPRDLILALDAGKELRQMSLLPVTTSERVT